VHDMLTGTLPFFDQGTLKALKLRVSNPPPQPPTADALGAALARLACTCMDPRTEIRPQDGGHLLRALYDLRI
jgi:hypothetical protein